MKTGKDKLSEGIINCIIEVHRTLGPGFLERIYRKALLIELESQNYKAETEKEISVFYKGKEVGRHRLDILVNDTVVIELKTVNELNRAHYAQVRSYLKATNLKLGILVNFATDKADFRRIES